MDLSRSLHGTGALLIRGLNEDARSLGMHLARLVFVGSAFAGCLIYFLQNRMFGAPGLAAFRFVVYADALFFTLMGTSHFAAAVAEEREQGMLGLLKMSGISPLGLLLGKSTTRLIPACLGLILQVPLIFLAITLGGIRYEQIGAAVCALLAFLVMLNNLCLFMSLISPTAQLAGQRTSVILILAYFIPQLLMIPSGVLPLGNQWWENSGTPAVTCSAIQQWIRDRHILTRIRVITESTFDESWLSQQVIFDVSLGLILFLLCWNRFESLTSDRELSTERRPDGRKVRNINREKSHPCWDEALAWKEFLFSVGGWRTIRLNFVGLLALTLAVFLLMLTYINYGLTWSQPPISNLGQLLQEFAPFPLIGAIVVGVIVFMMSFARSFAVELREKTFGTLMLIPHTKERFVVSMLGGRLLATLPMLVIFLLAAMWTLSTDNWLTRIPITGLDGWLLVSLFPCCVLVGLIDVSFWFFYLGLWKNSVGNGILAAITSCLVFYGECPLLVLIYWLCDFRNPPLTVFIVVIRIALSVLLWKVLWWRIKTLMDLRMAE